MEAGKRIETAALLSITMWKGGRFQAQAASGLTFLGPGPSKRGTPRATKNARSARSPGLQVAPEGRHQ